MTGLHTGAGQHLTSNQKPLDNFNTLRACFRKGTLCNMKGGGELGLER